MQNPATPHCGVANLSDEAEQSDNEWQNVLQSRVQIIFAYLSHNGS
jgi:hypothetical protein